jgi:hypothetical protein
MGLCGQRHAPAALTLEIPVPVVEGGWVAPRAGLDGYGKSRPTGIRSPERPTRSQSLYRLSQAVNTQLTVTMIVLQNTYSSGV